MLCQPLVASSSPSSCPGSGICQQWIGTTAPRPMRLLQPWSRTSMNVRSSSGRPPRQIVITLHEIENTMEEAVKNPTNRGEPAAAEQPKQPDHTAKIKSQVLAKIGIPPRFDRVEVCQHHNGKYRVNIWQQFELNRNIVVTPSCRIGPSYYLTVSDTGEILHSEPPMKRVSLDS
jgi:hypothetical protein